jgi:hypothetical protein
MRPPKDMLRADACTPVDHLYFAPSYWHLGTIGLWAGDAAPPPEANAAAAADAPAAASAQVHMCFLPLHSMP